MYKHLLILSSLIFLICFSCEAPPSEGAQVLSPKEFQKKLGEIPEAQFVDVRTEREFGEGHLGNFMNIDVSSPDFREKCKALDKDKPVFVYCFRGRRSAKAREALVGMGFKQIFDLEGGLTAWEEEGLEVK